MSEKQQANHFPCGPCPLLESIANYMGYYRGLLAPITEFRDAQHARGLNSLKSERELLLEGIVTDLEDLWRLAEATLTAYEIKEGLE